MNHYHNNIFVAKDRNVFMSTVGNEVIYFNLKELTEDKELEQMEYKTFKTQIDAGFNIFLIC